MAETKKIILVAEDEPAMLSILTDALIQSGFAALQAKDGDEGLRLSLEKHPDLILLDILMPKMDGLTMLKKLREDIWGRNVPVIILTNVSADTNTIIQSIVRDQPAYYIVKSDVKLEHIVEKVKEVLGNTGS